MSVAATFDFDPKEHYRASRAIQRAGSSRWLGHIPTLLFLGYGGYQIVLYGGRYPVRFVALLVFPWLLFGVLWPLMVPVSLWISARRLPRNNPSVTGPQQRTIDATGFHSRGNGVSVDLAWSMVYRAIETNEFFLLFFNKKAAEYIPKRALSTDAVAEARVLMREGVGSKAEVRS
jgi:hypothetical protein